MLNQEEPWAIDVCTEREKEARKRNLLKINLNRVKKF
jgi:hypothetical protein